MAGRVAHVLDPPPGIGRVELPCAAIVSQHDLDDLAQAGPAVQVSDRRDRLDATVEVALHDVRRADEELLALALAEHKDARVLEERADYRPDPDRLAEAIHSRPHGAH